jgi:ABC-type multidrug transport system ATPase subunit
MTSSKPNIAIEVANVSKRYRGKDGIQGVSAAFSNESLHLVVGSNGSGKTTLLKCIVGLVRFEGEIRKKHFRIGYAPEEYVMPHYMSIRDFLRSIGKIRDAASEGLDIEIGQELDYFDLRTHENKPIGKLSNGMRQKVNLIQAFLNHPKILLLDEPLRSLDQDSQEKAIGRIKERMGESLIIVSTHSPEKFKIRNKRIWTMTAGKIAGDSHA